MIGLNAARGPSILLSRIFEKRKVEDPDRNPIGESDVTLTWSEDDRYAAVGYAIVDDTDPRNRFRGRNGFNVLYLYSSETPSLQELCLTCEDAYMWAPKFSHDGRMIVVPWVVFPNSTTSHAAVKIALDVYDTASKQKLTHLLIDPPRPEMPHFEFQPHGKHLALLQAQGVILLDAEQSFAKSWEPVHTEQDQSWLFGFSADGTQLGLWSRREATMHLCNMDSHDVRSFTASAEHADPDPQACSGDLRELYVSFNSVVVSTTKRLILFSTKPTSFGQELFQIAHPRAVAVSRDGIFLAAMICSKLDAVLSPDPEEFTLLIYEMASGRQLHTYQDMDWHIDMSSYSHRFFTLSWASPGSCLFVGMRHQSTAGFNGEDYDGLVEELIAFAV